MSDETSLLDACATGVVIIQDGHFTYANESFCRLLGLDQNKLIGRDGTSLVHPDDRPYMRQRMSALLKGEVPATRAEVKLLRGDGTPMSLFVATTRCAFRGQPATLSTVIDIAGIRQSLGLASRAADMLLIARLAGGIAHDFNNLLLVIGGHTERLLAELPKGSARESVLAIQEATQRASLLTDHLLSFGQQQLLSPQTIDLSLLIGDVEDLLRRRVGDRIRLLIERPRRVPPITADRSRLVQVLLHLVDRARDSISEGGVITIAVDWIEADESMRTNRRWLPKGWFVRLQVIDNGVELPPETLSHLFEPFFQMRPDGDPGGMGLAMVYGLVKQSKGFIFVDSAPRNGTRVTVLFPPAVVDQLDASAPPPAVVEQPLDHPPLILLVEDENAVLELLGETLRRAGFDVLEAESAEAAIELRAERPFDVLIADVDLPGMNGAELAHALRTRAPELRVILMSGFGGDAMLEGAAEDDRLTLLRKPFPSAALIARLREMLPRGQ